MASAGALRTQANEYFRQKQWFEAERLYQQALAKCAQTDKLQLSQIHSQLSAVQLVLERVPAAIDSASKAIEFDAKNARAYVRRANAYSASMQWQKAYDDYQTALRMNPEENTFMDKMRIVETNLKQQGRNVQSPPEPVRAPPPEPIKVTNLTQVPPPAPEPTASPK